MTHKHTEFNPKKMLVTGAAGFIGSNFVRYELQKDQTVEIVSLDKLTYAGNLENLSNLPNKHHHTFIQGDICDNQLVSRILIDHQIDTIVHFAAESHVDRSIDNPAAFIQTNLVGTFTLLQNAKQIWQNKKILSPENCRFHHISTDEVYGTLKSNDAPFTETHPYQPNSPYSASKAGSDHLVRSFAHTYNLPTTISNCSNNYGSRQHPEKLIPVIIQSCLHSKTIPIYGNGLNIRDWIYVEDHCKAISLIIREGTVNNTYNIGGECEVSNIDLAKLICRLMDKKIHRNKLNEHLIRFVNDRAGHDWRYAINNKKIHSELKWRNSTTLKIGLEKTIDFYLKQGSSQPNALEQCEHI